MKTLAFYLVLVLTGAPLLSGQVVVVKVVKANEGFSVAVIDVETAREIKSIKAEHEPEIVWSAAGNSFAVVGINASGSPVVKVYSKSDWAMMSEFEVDHADTIYGLSRGPTAQMSHRGNQMALIGNAKTASGVSAMVDIVDLNSGHLQSRIQVDEIVNVPALSWSADDSRIAVFGCDSGRVWIFDSGSGKQLFSGRLGAAKSSSGAPIWTFVNAPDRVFGFSYLGEFGQFRIGMDGVAVLSKATVTQSPVSLLPLSVSDDGRFVVIPVPDADAHDMARRFVRIDTRGKFGARRVSTEVEFNSFAISSDGSQLATAGFSDRIAVVDASGGKLLRSYRIPKAKVSVVAIVNRSVQ